MVGQTAALNMDFDSNKLSDNLKEISMLHNKNVLTKEKVAERLEKSGGSAKELTIKNENLDIVSEDAFEEQGPTVHHLNLSNNKIRTIDLHTFSSMSNLKKLILSFNPIHTIDESVFSDLKSLHELEITNCNLRLVCENAFAGLTSLKRLILAYNDLEYIEPGTFAPLINVELIVLSFNRIKSLDDRTFSGLKKLIRLNLKANKLKQLSDRVFGDLVKLEQAILSVNEIASIDNVFANCSSLERLFIHTNRLEKLTDVSLKGLAKCRFIDMGSNRIVDLHPHTFKGMFNLEYLDLGKNQIKHLDSQLFEDAIKLEDLILSKNEINKLDENLFRNALDLKVFKFDFNKIRFMNPITFKHLQSLLEIYCNTVTPDNMKALQENIIKLNRQTFIDDINLVASFKDIASLLQSAEAFKCIERVSIFTNRHKIELFRLIEPKTLKRFTKVITIGLNYIFTDLGTHISKYKPSVDKPETMVLRFLGAFTSIIKNWSNTLAAFCNYFHDYSGIKIAINYLNSEVMKKSIIDKINDDSKYVFIVLLKIYASLLSTVYNLIKKEDPKFKNELVSLNAFESLIKIAEKFDSIGDFRFLAYLCLSQLADVTNVSHLRKITPVVKDLVDYTKLCTKSLQDENPERCPLIVDEQWDDLALASPKEALIIEVNESYYYVTDFLNVLYYFAISDEIKWEIYYNCRIRDTLETLIFKGNFTEKEFALKLLWQLCFDKKIAIDVGENTSLVNEISQLAALSNKENVYLIKNAKGIMFLLKDKSVNSGDEPKPAVASLAKKHLMISYNSKSRDVCLKIKQFVESLGYKVWIDVESIYGSSLESMANAIEQSFCVLLCVTEKYKESNNCRLEAEYVIAKKIPYIPLFLQANYKPDGWLGLVIGSRIFIDVNKLGLDKACAELKRCINLIKNEQKVDVVPETITTNETKPIDTSTTNSTNGSKTNVNASAMIWTETQVEKWLNETAVNRLIVESLIPCDGQVLYQLYHMLKFNPEFFYSSLKISGLNSFKDLKDIAYFSSQIKKLFES